MKGQGRVKRLISINYTKVAKARLHGHPKLEFFLHVYIFEVKTRYLGCMLSRVGQQRKVGHEVMSRSWGQILKK